MRSRVSILYRLDARKAAGKPYDKPNLVMNAAVQVCWEKAARYLEVEERFWYCTAERYVLEPKEAIDLVDENTILVCAILGSTYTGLATICNANSDADRLNIGNMKISSR